MAKFRFRDVGVDSSAAAPDDAAADPADPAAEVDAGGVVLPPQAAVASRIPVATQPASTERTRGVDLDSKICS